jgi:hypothetical protein
MSLVACVPDPGASRSAKAHRKLVRQRQGVKHEGGGQDTPERGNGGLPAAPEGGLTALIRAVIGGQNQVITG